MDLCRYTTLTEIQRASKAFFSGLPESFGALVMLRKSAPEQDFRSVLLTKWRTRLTEYERDGALVNGGLVVGQFVADLQRTWEAEDEALVDLAQASRISGYSGDHLRRCVREGKLTSVSQTRRLAFRVADLPRKAKRSVEGVPFDPQKAVFRILETESSASEGTAA